MVKRLKMVTLCVDILFLAYGNAIKRQVDHPKDSPAVEHESHS